MVTRRRRYFSVHFRLLNLFSFFYSLQYMIIWTNVPCLHVHSRRCVSLLYEKFCTGHFVQTLFLRKCHSILLFVFSDYNVFCVVHFISLFPLLQSFLSHLVLGILFCTSDICPKITSLSLATQSASKYSVLFLFHCFLL